MSATISVTVNTNVDVDVDVEFTRDELRDLLNEAAPDPTHTLQVVLSEIDQEARASASPIAKAALQWAYNLVKENFQ